MEFLGLGNEERKQARKERKDAKRDIRLEKKESRSMTPRERRMYEAENERLKIEAGLKETEALTNLAKSDSGGSNVIWYVLGGIVLIGGVYYFMRKKK
jgi:LPXTG-motif cell wall-anchored protein